jgi:hypothetical protein
LNSSPPRRNIHTHTHKQTHTHTHTHTRYPGLPADTDASVQAVTAGVDQDLGGYAAPPPLANSDVFVNDALC